MTVFGSRQRLCYSGWVLAALIIVAVNGANFLTLENQALEGYSPAIKSLQFKLNRLKNASVVRSAIDPDFNEIQGLFAVYRQPKPSDMKTGAMSVETDTSSVVIDEPTPPSLSGIIKITNESGAHYYAALVGGKVCRKNDVVMDFRILDISLRGIVLTRSGKRWFVKSPTTYYSSDQGE